MSTQISNAPTIRKKPVKTMLIYSAALAVCIGPPAPSVLSQYTLKATISAEPQVPSSVQAEYKMNFLNKSSVSYEKAEPYYKKAVVKKSVLKGDSEVLSNPDIRRNVTVIELPVVYGGKLPVTPEKNFTYSNEREKVNIARNVREISVPVTYGGRLPVGRERI